MECEINVQLMGIILYITTETITIYAIIHVESFMSEN